MRIISRKNMIFSTYPLTTGYFVSLFVELVQCGVCFYQFHPYKIHQRILPSFSHEKVAEIQFIENMPVVLREDSGNSAVNEPFQRFECDTAERSQVKADDRHKLREFGDGGGKATQLDNT